MADKYTLWDYNRHNVLKIPLALYATLFFLSKYVILFVLPRLPRMNRDEALSFLEENDITRTDLGLLAASLPAIFVLAVGLIRRVPDAGKAWQWIWNHGRIFLTTSATLELAILVLYVVLGHRELDGPVMAFVYIDLMILIYLFKSPRVVDVFADFPGPSPESAEPPDAFGPKRLGGRMAAPAVIFTTRVAVVHLGGSGLLELHRDCVLGVYAALSALGYDVVISPSFLHSGRMNLVIGFDRAQATTREQIREKKIDYMVYETESFHGEETVQRGATTIDIENDYLPALASAKMVISPFRGTVRTLADRNIEARYVRWGYVPELTESAPLPADRRDFDCYFFGEITPKRRELLRTLVDAGLTAKATGYPVIPAFLRNHYLSRSKLVLGLQRGGAADLVNPWRITYALQNNYCVVTEQQANDYDRYNAFGCETSTDEFAQRCRELIDSEDYRTACDEKRERLLSEPLTEFFKGVI